MLSLVKSFKDVFLVPVSLAFEISVQLCFLMLVSLPVVGSWEYSDFDLSSNGIVFRT